jgi:hypothetical protein
LVLGGTIAGEVLTAQFVFGGLAIIAAIALVGRATSREGQATKIIEQGRHASTTEKTSAAKAMNSSRSSTERFEFSKGTARVSRKIAGLTPVSVFSRHLHPLKANDY